MSKELVRQLRMVGLALQTLQTMGDVAVGKGQSPYEIADQAADLIERQNRIIEHLVELFVDTTTVENPERELVVIEARALIAPEEGE